jgi:acyl carrier protein
MSLRHDTSDLTVRLIAEIAEADVRSVHDDQRLREDLGLDSLQSLELLSNIGEALRIDLDIEEAMAIRTVADACAFVEREYARQRRDGDRRPG